MSAAERDRHYAIDEVDRLLQRIDDDITDIVVRLNLDGQCRGPLAPLGFDDLMTALNRVRAALYDAGTTCEACRREVTA